MDGPGPIKNQMAEVD